MNFLKRLEEIDPELAAEARQEIAEREEDGKVMRARVNLSETCRRYAYDETGQDGESEMDTAAEEYCDAQDSRMKRLDPDRWAEIRMGA